MFRNRQMIEYADAVYNAMNDEMVYRVKFNDLAGPIMIDARQLENMSDMNAYEIGATRPIHTHIENLLRRSRAERKSFRADNRGVHEFPPKIIGIETRNGRPWTISGNFDEIVHERVIVLEYEGRMCREARDVREIIHWLDEDLYFYGRRRDIDLVTIREQIARGYDLPDGSVEVNPRAERFEFNYRRAFVEGDSAMARYQYTTAAEPAPKPDPKPAPKPSPELPPTSPFKNFEI